MRERRQDITKSLRYIVSECKDAAEHVAIVPLSLRRSNTKETLAL